MPDPGLDAERQLECDLIMKGGVTSGVVYPAAVLELARVFRFRCIGGASAGAIAASLTAAAELGRQHRTSAQGSTVPAGAAGQAVASSGFTGMGEVAADLCRPAFVLERFKPAADRKTLLDLFLTWRRVGSTAPWSGKFGKVAGLAVRALVTLFTVVPLPTATGLVVGAALAMALCEPWIAWGVSAIGAAAAARALAVAVSAVLVAVAAFLGGVIGGGIPVLRAVKVLGSKERAGFGICPGSAGPGADLGNPDALALTDWLHVSINRLAGRGPQEAPVTFADLAQERVELRAMTSDLSLGQPFVIPLTRGTRSFFFRREEIEAFFPPPVASYLAAFGCEHRPSAIRFAPGQEDRYLRFPMGEEMPIVVAARLSLSFPVLLSAIRLYSFRSEAYDRCREDPQATVNLGADVEEHWFSDGGISSNFPIHLFDAWLPTRPTFGITLYDSPITGVLDQREVGREGDTVGNPDVFLPAPPQFERARPPRIRIGDLPEFLRAVFETAQNHADITQSTLPSYRERIAQVYLKSYEGGLNLDMPDDVLRGIFVKGEDAARQLLARYVTQTPGGPVLSSSFHEHVWVRILMLAAHLEREFAKLRQVHSGTGWNDALRRDLEALLEEQRTAQPSWYRSHPAPWCDQAKAQLLALLDLVAAWDRGSDKGPFSTNPPRPLGLLRVTSDT